MAYKVLFFVDYMAVGGIQTLLYNLLKAFDKNIIQCDYLVLDDNNSYEYESKFREAGGKIFKLENAWINSIWDVSTYCKSMDSFFKGHHDYKAIHVNASSKNFMVLYYAKKYGIKMRIMHSHNTEFQTRSRLKILLGNIMKLPNKMLATDYFACSQLAGEWLFGRKLVEHNKVTIIPNGVNADKYGYCEKIRDNKRELLGIKHDQIVIGNIGRFSTQKNHEFIIRIFSKVHELNTASILLLIGEGELRDRCEKLVRNLDLEDSVKFLGFRDDICDLVQAMDAMLMPSFHEGFPVTAVEAQASGCPCLFSDTITREAGLLDSTCYISLNESPSVWAETLLNMVQNQSDRKKGLHIVKEKGFDVLDTAKFLEKYYLNDN